jgi:N-acetylglutamate synthase-like GNAT family acetyltransferase
MQIRQANKADNPAIVALLQTTMSDSIIPKSESLWNWKHCHNPYGASYVLVAEEDGQLVGVRAFMKWQWQRKDTIFPAVRAVDTVTHPEFQGKGIFKTLTLQQVEICRQDAVRFVFNTPNNKSLPGYLKMEWRQMGKVPLKLKILQPISIARAKYIKPQKNISDEIDSLPFQKWTQDIFNLVSGINLFSTQLSTVVSPEYISWRYAHHPLITYNYFTDNENYLLVVRVNKHAFGKELRIVDFFKVNDAVDDRYLNKLIRNEVNSFCTDNNIGFISFSGQQYKKFRRCFKWMGFFPVLNIGPIVTVRDLNMRDDFENLLKVENWCYSIGDLEFF